MGNGMGIGKSYMEWEWGCPGGAQMAENGEKHENHLKWPRRLIKMRRNTHDLVLDFFFQLNGGYNDSN